jgi:rod shape-determining protein MreC
MDARLDVAAAAACVVAAFVAMALPAPTRDAVAGALRRAPMAPLVALQERAELARRTFRGHDAAAQVADSVALRSMRLDGVEAENAQLRRLLGLGAALKWGFVPAEALRGRGIGDEQTMLLSAGRAAGVELLSPVVTPDGLLGVVERADATMATAILWPHPDFAVSAMSADGDAYGMVRARGGTGPDRFFLVMRGVLLRNQLQPGAIVVTSGLGGVYPRGIPVGTVVAELKTPDQWARTYLIRPAVPLSSVGSVMVLRPERVRAGVPNVWASAAGSDSAARRIVSAIDSIARLTGDSNTVRQRRILADSATRRDSARRRVP